MANLTFDFLHNYVTGERRASDPADAYQYDEGHVLEAVVPVAVTSCEIQYWIRGMERADAYTPTSITQNTDNTYTILGNIPNSYFETNGDLRVYIVVTDGDASITTYEGYIHIKERQMPEDYVDDDPDNEAVRVIAEARAAAATATEKAGEAAASAEQAQEILDSIPEDYTQLTEDVSDLKEDFHSYHSELGAGYADQLVSSIENTDSVPYNFRAVPYDATLEQVEGIVGVDVVLNQLVKNKPTASQNGVTFINNGNGTYTVNGTASSDAYFVLTDNLVKQHTYFVSVNGAVNTAIIHIGYENTLTRSAKIITANGTNAIGFRVNNGDTADSEVVTPQVFDLTQTFGTAIADYVYSLEQATAGAGVAWLKEHFPKIFDAGYVPYNAGTMVHVSGLSAKRTVGFNQWDEQWEVGAYSGINGGKASVSDRIRCKNLIPVIPGMTYYIKAPNSLQIYFYDADGNYIDWNAGTQNVTRTFNDNVHFITFNCAANTATTYNHDICINLSDPTKNGTYEPYTEHTYPLDDSLTLRGIPKLDAQNNLYFDGDEYLPDGTVNRRYGVVDLGTLEWHAISGYAGYFKAVTTEAVNIENEVVANALCPKYVTVKGNDLASKDKVIAVGMNNAYEIQIGDSAYSTASASDFRNALAGVMLLYKKRLFTTETAEPYTQTQICDPNGTEEYISETVAPVGHITKYPLDVAGRLDNILSMPTANGTYTLRATVNNGKVTYSWVSA